jgi:hypothetical protein
MRLRYVSGTLFLVMLCGLPSAHAQLNFDLGVGFGTARDASNNTGVDNLNSINALQPCIPNSGDPDCQKTTSMGGFDLGFMGDWMVTKLYGFGAEVTTTPAHQNYLQPPSSSAGLVGGQPVSPLAYRQTFFDVNGILDPINQKRVQVQVQGGFGLSHTGIAVNESGCVVGACSTSFQPVGSANHFQVHVGVGVMVFVTEHIFVKPEFDFHYVPSLGGVNGQFNSDAVPQFMVWVGYGWH